VQEVYLDGQPVNGQGQQRICPCEKTTYTLHVITQNGQPEDRQVTVDVYGTCDAPPELPSDVVIEFWSDAPYVDAGQCTTVRWDVSGVDKVFLDDQPVVGQGSEKVCLCEPETYTLHVVKRDGKTEDRQVTVDVYGACETSPEVTVIFRPKHGSVKAGECTYLVWDVQGVKGVYLDDEPVEGSGRRQVCPCEPQTYTLTVIGPDGSAEDYHTSVDVSGSCQTSTQPQAIDPQVIQPIVPILPPLRFIPLETAEPILY
jgi:hypothetical protein